MAASANVRGVVRTDGGDPVQGSLRERRGRHAVGPDWVGGARRAGATAATELTGLPALATKMPLRRTATTPGPTPSSGGTANRSTRRPHRSCSRPVRSPTASTPRCIRAAAITGHVTDRAGHPSQGDLRTGDDRKTPSGGLRSTDDSGDYSILLDGLGNLPRAVRRLQRHPRRTGRSGGMISRPQPPRRRFQSAPVRPSTTSTPCWIREVPRPSPVGSSTLARHAAERRLRGRLSPEPVRQVRSRCRRRHVLDRRSSLGHLRAGGAVVRRAAKSRTRS